MNEQKAILSDEQVKARRGRSVALAISLAVLVALFYAVTIAKLGAGIIDRPF
ncbi:hypothetical protein [Pseudovibrio sp. Tun.PSC04-5.I4]|uniref:hypothetical protein n=1 Tax=Pseudovibrio sp. Tun.PSC04-5.I4 TaxID=1798213 RepID=UPI00088AB335|nr:hypothetical protein [Pseudovibrio sp. Tun.PSC04-5.I4]SDQ79833.1 hypothetical protein SAMN04515695_1438 [Pseudovibrio sp. Tun.PSC04-5.I4]